MLESSVIVISRIQFIDLQKYNVTKCNQTLIIMSYDCFPSRDLSVMLHGYPPSISLERGVVHTAALQPVVSKLSVSGPLLRHISSPKPGQSARFAR